MNLELSHSRNSSASESLISRKSSGHSKEPRRNVGDKVLITSDSKVYVNHNNQSDGVIGALDNVNEQNCDEIDYEILSNSIRSSRDLAKFRNRIFEDSLESQEVTFYLGWSFEKILFLELNVNKYSPLGGSSYLKLPGCIETKRAVINVKNEDQHCFVWAITSALFPAENRSSEVSSYPHYSTVLNTADENADGPEYENVFYDTFDSDSEFEFEQVDEVELRRNIAENPLPPEPEGNGFDKFTQNLRKLKNSFSRDITKSLRRISKRMSLAEPELKVHVPEPVPPLVIHTEDEKSDLVLENDCHKTNSSITKIIRSAVSVASLSNYFGTTQNRRRSTFYDYDTDYGENEKSKTSNENNSRLQHSPAQTKPKVVRPKIPPPPVPVENIGKAKVPNDQQNRKSLYSEAGLFKKNNFQNKHDRTSCYAEIGLYPKSPSEAPTCKNETIFRRSTSTNGSGFNDGQDFNKKPVFSCVLDELNFKLIKNNEEVDNFENESTYNNQSLDSFNSSDSKKDDSSEMFAVNELRFLEDEPLYQFYDPTSISDYDNSDIENDIYEDVEEKNEIYISSTQSPDLSSVNRSDFNFTRSLWCETPEVIKSAILGKLSSQQKKVQEAKFEVITSEASYLNSLNVLCNHFESKFAKSNIVNEIDMNELFGKVKEVKSSSKKIMRDLEKCWQGNILLDGICDIIQRHAEENFRVYIPYCEKQVTLSETLNRMREKPEFVELLTELETSATCQFLTLYSFLMLPMQRITRWPLLVDAILKRLSESDPEYLTCQYALATLNKIVSQCNDAARKKDQENELKRISQSLEFPKGVPPIVIQKPERWLMKSGHVISFQPRNGDTQMTLGKRFNKVPLDLFLFTDLFLVTKRKSDKLYTVMHHCPRSMIELRRVDMFPTILKKEAQDKKHNLLYISILENQEGKIIELLLSNSTESDKERWIEAFSPPKSENPDETVYECWDCPQMKALHNYNGCQPDELSLSKGDVINVLRKMNDGWYHGEKLRDGQTGWFPANYTTEIVNPHVRARNLRQKYRLLTFSENYLNSP